MIAYQYGMFGPGVAFCAICGRRLSDPQSVGRGIGPVCAGKSHEQGEGEEMAEKRLGLPVEERGFVFDTHLPTHAD